MSLLRSIRCLPTYFCCNSVQTSPQTCHSLAVVAPAILPFSPAIWNPHRVAHPSLRRGQRATTSAQMMSAWKDCSSSIMKPSSIPVDVTVRRWQQIFTKRNKTDHRQGISVRRNCLTPPSGVTYAYCLIITERVLDELNERRPFL